MINAPSSLNYTATKTSSYSRHCIVNRRPADTDEDRMAAGHGLRREKRLLNMDAEPQLQKDAHTFLTTTYAFCRGGATKKGDSRHWCLTLAKLSQDSEKNCVKSLGYRRAWLG